MHNQGLEAYLASVHRQDLEQAASDFRILQKIERRNKVPIGPLIRAVFIIARRIYHIL